MARITAAQREHLRMTLLKLMDEIILYGDDPVRWFPFTATNTIGVMRQIEALSTFGRLSEKDKKAIMLELGQSIKNLKGQIDAVLNKYPYLSDAAELCDQILVIAPSEDK